MAKDTKNKAIWSAKSGKKVGVRFEWPNGMGGPSGRGTRAYNEYGKEAKRFEAGLKKKHGEHYSRVGA
jgi:hypothetical protein